MRRSSAPGANEASSSLTTNNRYRPYGPPPGADKEAMGWGQMGQATSSVGGRHLRGPQYSAGQASTSAVPERRGNPVAQGSHASRVKEHSRTFRRVTSDPTDVMGNHRETVIPAARWRSPLQLPPVVYRGSPPEDTASEKDLITCALKRELTVS